MDEKISSNVTINGRLLSLKADRFDEQKIRLAAKLVDERMKIYKEKYPEKDNEDCLTMVALQYAIKSLNVDNDMMETPLEAAINDVVDDIDRILSER